MVRDEKKKTKTKKRALPTGDDAITITSLTRRTQTDEYNENYRKKNAKDRIITPLAEAAFIELIHASDKTKQDAYKQTNKHTN